MSCNNMLIVAAGVSAHAHKNWGTDYEGHAIFVRSVSLVLMVLSIFMAIYAAYNFHYRGEMLQCVSPSPQAPGSDVYCIPTTGQAVAVSRVCMHADVDCNQPDQTSLCLRKMLVAPCVSCAAQIF